MNISFSKKDFEEDGFVVVRNVISLSTIQQLNETISNNIKNCASQLAVSGEEYLSIVSRWVSPSSMTAQLEPLFLSDLTKIIEKIIESPIILNKFNVICKNAQCKGAVPYHQDIAYSPQNPYQFSAWLSLHTITETSGPLEVIPKSHLGPISPAVDFWSPEFVPESNCRKKVQKLFLNPGDIVFFDSRLWHGSAEKKDLFPRYALVTRWTTKNWQSKQRIPSIIPKFFGMWTSGQITQEILSQGLQIFFNKKEDDFLSLIEAWIEILEKNLLSFTFNRADAGKNLKKVKILHLASIQQNGGDATGKIYKNLWHNFLSPLLKNFPNFEEKQKFLDYLKKI